MARWLLSSRNLHTLGDWRYITGIACCHSICRVANLPAIRDRKCFLLGRPVHCSKSSTRIYWLPALCGGYSLLVDRQVFYNFLFFHLYSFSRTGSWSWTSSYDFKFISMKVLMVWVAHLHRACRSSLVCLYPLLNLKMHLS